MVSKETIEQILSNIIDLTDAEKCNKPNYKAPNERAEIFNEKDFAEEFYEDEDYAHPNVIDYGWESPQGMIQWKQSELQENVNYTHDELDIAQEWSTSLFLQLNRWLFKGEGKGSDRYDYNDDYTLKKASDILSKAIQKSPKLQESVVTYRYGPLGDLSNMEVGEHGTFDGYQSTSFNYTVALKALKKQVCGWCKGNRGMIRVFNPKGTTGMVIDDTVSANDWQSEWLLDKGQKYVVVGKGDVNIGGEMVTTIDVLLYD